ncbi:hypothetical protein BCR44DRAFT_1256557 [Catenaria anguillulae PL171]|uniref:Uncharacterized protein n=1 Tax=Catenaria anguillulae PL171 TaxID=765915 RepID=A0A1Y2HG53_9FUNG|nr:hypothetical protein BCR44DRAFT_1256557 [Catenaria anguillulae PL171]
MTFPHLLLTDSLFPARLNSNRTRFIYPHTITDATHTFPLDASYRFHKGVTSISSTLPGTACNTFHPIPPVELKSAPASINSDSIQPPLRQTLLVGAMCALTNTPRCGPIGARFFTTWFFLIMIICLVLNRPLAHSAPLPANPNVTFTGTPRSLNVPRLDLFPARLTTIFQVGLNNINPTKTRPVSTILSSPLPASIDSLSAWPGAITQLKTRNASFVPHAPIASLHFSSVAGTDLGRRVHTAFTSATETAIKPVLSLVSLVPTVFALIAGALRDSVQLIQIHDHEHEVTFLAERVYRTCPLSAVASHLGRNATSVNGDAGVCRRAEFAVMIVEGRKQVLNHDDVPTNFDRLYMHATRDSSSYTSYFSYSNSSNKDRQSHAKSHGNTSRTSLNLPWIHNSFARQCFHYIMTSTVDKLKQGAPARVLVPLIPPSSKFSALEFNHTMCLHRYTPLTLQENKLPAQSSMAPVQSTHPDRRQEEAANGSMFKLVGSWMAALLAPVSRLSYLAVASLLAVAAAVGLSIRLHGRKAGSAGKAAVFSGKENRAAKCCSAGKVGEAKEAKSGKGKRKKNKAKTAKAGVKEATETFQAPPIANPQHISWADFAYFDELEDAANASSDAPFAYNDDGHPLESPFIAPTHPLRLFTDTLAQHAQASGRFQAGTSLSLSRRLFENRLRLHAGSPSEGALKIERARGRVGGSKVARALWLISATWRLSRAGEKSTLGGNRRCASVAEQVRGMDLAPAKDLRFGVYTAELFVGISSDACHKVRACAESVTACLRSAPCLPGLPSPLSLGYVVDVESAMSPGDAPCILVPSPVPDHQAAHTRQLISTQLLRLALLRVLAPARAVLGTNDDGNGACPASFAEIEIMLDAVRELEYGSG